MSPRFRVAYRIGGTLRWQWRWVLEAFGTEEKAQAYVDDLGRSGYSALILPIDAKLPTTYLGDV